MLPSKDRIMYDALVNSVCNDGAKDASSDSATIDGAKALGYDDMAPEIEPNTPFIVSGSENLNDEDVQRMVPSSNVVEVPNINGARLDVMPSTDDAMVPSSSTGISRVDIVPRLRGKYHGAKHEGAKGDVMVPSVVCDDGEWVPATVKDGGASSMSESSDNPKLNAFKLLMDRRTDSPASYRAFN